MATVKYIMSVESDGGAIVPCEIMEKNETGYRIEFFDDFINEVISRWVKYEELIFPRFADIVYP